MTRFLLDTNVLGGHLQGRPGAVRLVQPWVIREEAVSSILVYGEVIEYLKGRSDFVRRQADLRRMHKHIRPLGLTYSIMERYADLRRSLRPPYGPGLIGDVDTLIAATAMEHGLTVVTSDGDFSRVMGLSVILVPRASLT